MPLKSLVGRELNESLDLVNRKRRKTFVNIFDRVAQLEAVRNSFGIMRVPRTTGFPETFPGTDSINSQAIQSISDSVAIVVMC